MLAENYLIYSYKRFFNKGLRLFLLLKIGNIVFLRDMFRGRQLDEFKFADNGLQI